VLDATRYDLWTQVVGPTLAAASTSVHSVGSASVEWINETFADEHSARWRRAGYVTGNPHTAKPGGHKWRNDSVYPLSDRGLAYLDEVWRDRWDVDGMETVTPSDMTARGLWAWSRRDRFNIDTLVVHYMQPHVPFRNGDWTDGWKNTLAFGEPDKNPGNKDAWKKLRDGEVLEDEFWAAYRDNLGWVLEELDVWKRAVDGTVLVTSDHGNAAGEMGQWGHPPGSANPVLRKVPWAVLEADGDGVDIEPPGDPPVLEGIGDVDVAGRLGALGYR